MNLCSEVKRKMQAGLSRGIAARRPGIDRPRSARICFTRIYASEEAKFVKITHGEIALTRP
jgi:hypothetical protein